MTRVFETLSMRSMLSGMLMLLLANCQMALPLSGGDSEALKSLCAKWYESLPTWGEEDTEATKDEIDYSYRLQEKLCERIEG